MGYADGMKRWEAIAWSGLLLIGSAGLAHGQAQEFTLEGESWTQAQGESAEPRLAEARRLLAADQPGEALSVLNEWISAHKFSDSPHLSEAYLLRGDAKLARSDEYEALFDYEIIIKQFYSSPEFPKAVEREYEIAGKYLGGLRRKWFGWFRIESARSLGEELMIRVQERMPGSQLAEMAALDLGDYYYKGRDLPMAADMYGIFVANYPESENRRYAALREIFASIASYKGPRYDQSRLVQAQVLIEDFQARYPAEAEQAGVTVQLANWVDESAAAHMLDTAKWYLRRQDEESARYTLTRLIGAHPHSAASAQAIKILDERGMLAKDQQEPPPDGQTQVDDHATP